MKQLITFIALSFCIAMSSHAAQEPELSGGVGLGIPYGLLGVNGEIKLHEYAAVSAGIGIGLEEPAFAFGGHLLIPTEISLKPRLSAYYSTAVAAIEVCEFSFFGEDNGCEYEQFAGTALGLGFVVKHFQFELLFIDSPDFDDKKKEYEARGAELGSESELALVLAYRF